MKGDNEGSSKDHPNTSMVGVTPAHTAQHSPTTGASTPIEADVSILNSIYELYADL
jgi:hypothetical protein